MSATPQGNHAALPPRGACGSPAAPAVTRVHPCAGGGGLSLCRGALDGRGLPLTCCAQCARRNPKHGRHLHAVVLNEWRQWECGGQVLHDERTVRPRESGVIHRTAVGVSTA